MLTALFQVPGHIDLLLFMPATLVTIYQCTVYLSQLALCIVLNKLIPSTQ